MSHSNNVLNELLVELFNFILQIEERNLKIHNFDNLSMTEVHVIEAIAKSPNKSMGDIAKRLMVTVGTLTTSVNRLVEKGYVVRDRDASDRRIVLLGLTSEGEKANHIHEEFHRRMIDKILEETHAGDDELLIESLTKIKEFFYSLKDVTI